MRCKVKKKRRPELGEERERHVFLWGRTTAQGTTRWLEWAFVKERCYLDDYTQRRCWYVIEWLDLEDEDES